MKAVILAALVIAGCASSQRESTIKAALVSVDATRDAFVVHDQTKQAAIVAQATSLEQGRAELAAYRADRAKVDTAFSLAYRAIAVALTLNDEPSLAGVKAALQQVAEAISGGGK